MTDVMTTVKAAATGMLSGLATVSILGIPATGFLTALIVSALNNTTEAVPGRSVPALLKTVLFHTLIGGYVALVLIKLPAFKGYGLAEVGITIAAPLVTLCVPWLRDNAKDFAAKVKEIALAWLSKMFGGNQ